MKIEQEIMEMFDERFTLTKEEIEEGWRLSESEIKSFISEIITLVQKREREEVVEGIVGLIEDRISGNTGEYPFPTFKQNIAREIIKLIQKQQ